MLKTSIGVPRDRLCVPGVGWKEGAFSRGAFTYHALNRGAKHDWRVDAFNTAELVRI